MKKIVFSLLLSVLISVLSALLFASSAYAQIDSNHALEIIAENLRLKSIDEKVVQVSESFSQDGSRDFWQMRLMTPENGEIQILVSGPKGFRSLNQKFPVLFVSAGFASGMQSIRLFSSPGDMIVVGFEYPATQTQIEQDLSLLPKTIRIVPGQIALTLEWLSQQPYVDVQRMNVMGVSLGSLFMPLSLRLAGIRGVNPRTVTLAYGGADPAAIISNFLPAEAPEWLRNPLLEMVDGIFTLHNPKLHLPHLTGKVNCIYGTNDNVFPKETSLEQFSLLTAEKEIHWIEGPHIDVDQPSLILETTNLVMDFLRRTN